MSPRLLWREVVPINDLKNITVPQRNEMGSLFTVKKIQPERHLLPREKIHHPFFLFAAVVVQLLSHVQLVVNPWTAALQASLPFTIS